MVSPTGCRPPSRNWNNEMPGDEELGFEAAVAALGKNLLQYKFFPHPCSASCLILDGERLFQFGTKIKGLHSLSEQDAEKFCTSDLRCLCKAVKNGGVIWDRNLNVKAVSVV